MRSKDALNAHFVTFSSISAFNISSGSVSPQARSVTQTSPPSTEYPKSKISNLSTNKCEDCGSIIVHKTDKWLLSKKEIIEQGFDI